MKNEYAQTFLPMTKYFKYEDKEFYLIKLNKTAEQTLKELIDAINTIDLFFVTKQYPGIPGNKSTKRLPRVEFFVIGDSYDIANKLMVSILQEFGMAIKCRLEYHAEFEEVDNYAIETGVVILTYVIEFEVCLKKYYTERYAKLVAHINEFASKVNRSVG